MNVNNQKLLWACLGSTVSIDGFNWRVSHINCDLTCHDPAVTGEVPAAGLFSIRRYILISKFKVVILHIILTLI